MKKILLVLAIAGFTSVAMAQNTTGYQNVSDEKYQVFTNRFWDNWFIMIGGGGEMMLGNRDVHGSFKDRISPTANFSIGKWFSPGLGLRAQYSGLQARGYTDDPSNIYIDGGRDADGYYKQKIKYMNIHGDILFNVSAMLGGYSESRGYEFIPFLGFGFTNHITGHANMGLAVNGGIINRFRLGKHWDLNLELAIMGTENDFDGELGGDFGLDGNLYASLGFTYRFPKANFDKPMAARQLISEAELRNMRDRMNSLAAENQNLQRELAQKPDQVTNTEVVVVEREMAPRSVFFTIGSAKINAQELINLDFVAEQMKEAPNQRYKVTGYADSATGSAQLNQRLSQQRAEAVVNTLVNNHNIARDRFTVNAAGGVAIYDKPYLNRMVMIEVMK